MGVDSNMSITHKLSYKLKPTKVNIDYGYLHTDVIFRLFMSTNLSKSNYIRY
jgi:hypothetical protein